MNHMNYIWEVLLQAMKEDISEEYITFLLADNPNPYLETAFENVNPCQLSEIQININPFYRFGNIFQALLDRAMSTVPDTGKFMFDVLVHFLAQLDLLDGMSRLEYYACFLRRDVEEGCYGKNHTDILQLFPFDQRRYVLEHMVRLYQNGPSVYLLRSLLCLLYPLSMLYLDTTDHQEILVYIGNKQTAILAQQVDFLLELFVPINYTVHLFWDMHFGIISVNETMQIDEIMIY